jgi:3-isopropylmalate dehydrogenase
MAKQFPKVKYEHRLVDSCALDLVNNPRQFECIVTENLFGDILSDQASALIGTLGMLTSASLGSGISLYEPGHGSALELKDKNLVNPIAMIKAVGLMYLHSFNSIEIYNAIEKAIETTLNDDILTKDLDKDNFVTTEMMVTKIIERIEY